MLVYFRHASSHPLIRVHFEKKFGQLLDSKTLTQTRILTLTKKRCECCGLSGIFGTQSWISRYGKYVEKIMTRWSYFSLANNVRQRSRISVRWLDARFSPIPADWPLIIIIIIDYYWPCLTTTSDYTWRLSSHRKYYLKRYRSCVMN